MFWFILYNSHGSSFKTFQIRGMHTIIRDAKTTTHDFIFYADRLIRLVGTSFTWHPMVAQMTRSDTISVRSNSMKYEQ